MSAVADCFVVGKILYGCSVIHPGGQKFLLHALSADAVAVAALET